jgi:hypothetical protein
VRTSCDANRTAIGNGWILPPLDEMLQTNLLLRRRPVNNRHDDVRTVEREIVLESHVYSEATILTGSDFP